ncbi:hypothetical protein IMG5_009370 [Ichthyophthirius multifiliis]|uniref:Transmembrane protein n=1 Tax=Ichthyophthirius multifiliis TaxID=5932 RepID=G0QJV0_ICHMU|nr:hypothetical protein IMG5_009370 [Ichthyophthirius multifiliis]EGR34501.1 hypothetical protein IMG5_009370 [Ichthyophthirius multifiliis]|eukprot:XP_004039805.1 hypothetical protein IMG5_009370 [Ichthyophthirius multifiliis]
MYIYIFIIIIFYYYYFQYCEAFQKIITQRRLMQLQERVISLNEFVIPLSNQPNIYAQEYIKYREFWDEMSGVKARRKKKMNPEGEDDKKGKQKKFKRRKNDFLLNFIIINIYFLIKNYIFINILKIFKCIFLKKKQQIFITYLYLKIYTFIFKKKKCKKTNQTQII